MIGYVNIHSPELKVKELVKYRAYYCGLCRFLCKKFNEPARLALSYDFTFLLMLHTSLYGTKNKKGEDRCPIHPISKTVVLINEYTAYSADMNMYMVYKKIQDDVQDDKKVISAVLEKTLRARAEQIRKVYPEKVGRIDGLQIKLNEYEIAENKDLEVLSSIFGEILSEVFVIKEDEWAPYLSKIGFFFGEIHLYPGCL